MTKLIPGKLYRAVRNLGLYNQAYSDKISSGRDLRTIVVQKGGVILFLDEHEIDYDLTVDPDSSVLSSHCYKFLVGKKLLWLDYYKMKEPVTKEEKLNFICLEEMLEGPL